MANWQVFDEMHERRVNPNARIYVALVKGLCKVDQLNKAIRLKDEMLRKKV